MTGPSPHLRWAELACKDGAPYPVEWRTTRLPLLAEAFEHLRLACGNVPLIVLSAYRTPAHNARVGGARLSQHVQGRALDLQVPPHLTLKEFANLARAVRAEPGSALRGIGIYPGFLHIDVRPSDRLVVWYGARYLADAHV